VQPDAEGMGDENDRESPATRDGGCRASDDGAVAVSLSVIDGRLADVKVLGDFVAPSADESNLVFLAIAAALTGTPADVGVPALAAVVRSAIPFGVEPIGVSPEAIATATRRAVGENGELNCRTRSDRIGSFTSSEIDALTAAWHELSWRLIPERPLPPAVNVALDEVLADHVAGETSTPVLRFWKWEEPAVVIGRCQSLSNEVDLAAAAEMGVRIVRRMTGGGAMFVRPHGAITYSLCLPEGALAGLTIRQSYEVCDAWAIRGLRDLGIDAHHVPVTDIACADGKIGGAAQARRRGVVLHHTTIAYDLDGGEMARVLRIGRPKLTEKTVASAQKRVSPLVRQTGRGREAVVEHLFASFRRRYGGTTVALTADELAAAEQLVAEKYGQTGWTEEFA
jgi:lipoate---protein ligase